MHNKKTEIHRYTAFQLKTTRRKISLGDPGVNHEGNIKIHLSLSSANNSVSCCDITCPRPESVPLADGIRQVQMTALCQGSADNSPVGNVFLVARCHTVQPLGTYFKRCHSVTRQVITRDPGSQRILKRKWCVNFPHPTSKLYYLVVKIKLEKMPEAT